MILFYGAGSACVGVAEQIMGVMAARGLNPDVARKAFYLVDTKGIDDYFYFIEMWNNLIISCWFSVCVFRLIPHGLKNLFSLCRFGD